MFRVCTTYRHSCKAKRAPDRYHRIFSLLAGIKSEPCKWPQRCTLVCKAQTSSPVMLRVTWRSSAHHTRQLESIPHYKYNAHFFLHGIWGRSKQCVSNETWPHNGISFGNKKQKTLESPMDSREMKSVNPKGNQPWIFIGRTDAEALILCPPDTKSRLIGKDPDAGKGWR